MASRDIKDAHPLLRERYERLCHLWFMRYTFRRLSLTCVWRSPEEQGALYAQGRSLPGRVVTNLDGVQKPSNHNLVGEDGGPRSRAVDVVITLLAGEPQIVKPTVTWNSLFYRPLIGLAAEVGLVSGGSWKMKDWPHLELPPEVSP